MTDRSVNMKKTDIANNHLTQSKQKILMAAFKLFAHQGYSRTSVENIAQEAKISKGLIYHYFDSKTDILKGLFVFFRKEMDEFYQWKPDDSPQEVLQSIIDVSVQFIVKKKQMNRMMMALAVQPEVTASIREEMEEMRATWSGILTDLFKKINYKDPETEAYMLTALLDGMGIGYMAMKENYPIKKMKALIKARYGL